MKNRHFTVSLIVTAFAIIALVGLGCKEIRGGGWIPAAENGDGNEGKATFNFNASCKDLTPAQLEKLCPGEPEGSLVSINLQYHDHVNTWNGYPVKFRGFVQSIDCLNTCLELDDLGLDPNVGVYTGYYLPEPWGQFKDTPNNVGTLVAGVVDNGEPGIGTSVDDPDLFALELEDGIFSGYTNGGELGGGNVHVFPE